ncbi:MAG TPA: hypothetical protein VGN61_12175 [Verrucomicrobiae bacterium]
MKDKNTSVVTFSQGDIYLWPEQESSIMIKAITKRGDPVELTPEEARELGETLMKMATKIK